MTSLDYPRHRFRFGPAAVLGLAAVVSTIAAADAARAAESHAFAARLQGEPQVACIVTTPEEPCSANRVRGDVVPEAEPTFDGTFDFKLPGLRASRAPIGRSGRGVIEGMFLPGGDAAPVRCTFEGRLRVQGVAVPAGAAMLRFHTGSFQARGRCGGEPAVMRAIWSGSIGNTDGEQILSFERFEGRLAGSIRIRDEAGEETFYLP